MGIGMANSKREALRAQIAAWHENDEHGKIIEAINEIPREFWDYEAVSFYARALNNMGRYEEALEILESVRALGRNDALWHYRTGYSLYFLGREEEAADYIQQAIDLGDDQEDTRELLAACLEEAAQKKEGIGRLAVYSKEELNALEGHIEKYFGPYKNVFHEIASPDIHVDIALIEPVPERNYYVLVTMGMGARKMDIPRELEEYRLERAEIMVCLPPDWKLGALDDEKWYWPLRWLKILARLPGEENTWLGWGHTIPNGGPFSENTRLSAVMLINPGAFDQASFECKLPGGGVVNFYQMLPLYDEELAYKLSHDADALLERMDGDALEYVRLDRKNLQPGN
jgi:tetratricopeptide (TPR) repeat protein